MTTFIIAEMSQQYKDCHEILDKLGRTAAQPLSFPTVVAYRDNRAVAFISTINPKKAKAIMVGELAIDPQIKQPQHLLVKLIDMYERALFNLGVVSYIFCIPLDRKEWIARMEQVSGMKPYTKDSKLAWYNRRLIQKEAA